ncbi:MAG: GEVED domain-containing protein, partial [Chitinophagales bacterium]
DVLTISADGTNDTYVVTSTSGSASMILSVPTGSGSNVAANISVNGKPACNATNTTYDSPSNCNCSLTINGISTGACSYNAITEASEFLLTYTVSWTDGIVGESIEVIAGGTIQSIYIAEVNGSATREVTARADGASNTVTANLSGGSGCSQTANYTAVNPCPPCELEIAYVNVLPCENDGANSTQDIEVGLEWLYAGTPDVITVTIDGQTETLAVSAASGTGFVTLTGLPADGLLENVSAAFNADGGCSANDTYTANADCPNCTLTVSSSSVGDCSYDPTEQDNSAVLTVNLSWTNAFNGEFINIVTQDTISTVVSTGADYASGSATANLTVPSTGLAHDFTAYLGANYDQCVVEDEAYTAPDDCIEYDWGDAPDSYLTDNVGATEGPSHALRTGLFIGDLVDSESNGAPATTGNVATGDDSAAGNMTVGTAAVDDEEGISSFPALTTSLIGSAYTVNVSVTNTTSSNANLIGWVDFDNDGIFSSNEAVSASVPGNSNDITVALAFTVPTDLEASFTYARFRLTTDSSITTSTPGGVASDGEVEDYEITVSCPSGKCGRVTVVRH